MTNDQKDVLKQAIEIFGKSQQMEMAMEECAELIVAINKIKRANPIEQNEAIDKMLSEVADVEIMCEQLKIMFEGYRIVEAVKAQKITRLDQRIKIKLGH